MNDLFPGDPVRLREPGPGHRHYLRDARIETVSACGRYVVVSGIRSGGKNRVSFSVMATDVKRIKRKG